MMLRILDAASSYPQFGVIACVVLGIGPSDDGRRLAHIDTQTPWGVESLAGRSRFDVFPEQLVPLHGDFDGLSERIDLHLSAAPQ